MATFLDVSGLQGFSNILVFLFISVVVYAAMGMTKTIGENKGINILVAVLFGTFVLFSPLVTDLIVDLAPVIALIFLFGIFAQAGITYLGGDTNDQMQGVKIVTYVILVLVVVVFATTKIRDNLDIPGDDGVDSKFDSAVEVIFHPKIMGMIFIFIISIFAILLLAGKQYHF
ncbi:MAG: hypothetical protein O2779_05035 [Nanoarchaeota archaeon]|nr:hypothetical protein [Nanoarchaeota archaeon]